MALPDELDISELDADGHADPEASYAAIRDAIDAASDQDHTTWLTVDGKRIARIAPVDEIPAAVTAWAADARISASEFMALDAGRRRAVLDQFYQRLRSGSSDQSEPCPECGRTGTCKLDCSRRS